VSRRSKNQHPVLDERPQNPSPSLFEMLLAFMALLVVLAVILAIST